MNCAVLYQAYMTRCAVENYNNYSDGRETDFGADHAASDGVQPEGDGIDPTGQLDSSGFLGAGTCEIPASISVLGNTYSFDPDGALCSFFGVLSLLVLLGAYYVAAKVILGGQ